MSGVLARAAGLFVVRSPAPAPPPSAPDVVVVAGDTEALPVAACVAAGGGGVVAHWPPCDLPAAAALPRARARAAQLDALGLAAVARGRVTFAALPEDPRLARAALVRSDAAVDGPRVTAICGPRAVELDDVLAAHDVAVLVVPPEMEPEVLVAASHSIARLVPDVRTTHPLTGPARLAALTGLLASRAAAQRPVAGAG